MAIPAIGPAESVSVFGALETTEDEKNVSVLAVIDVADLAVVLAGTRTARRVCLVGSDRSGIVERDYLAATLGKLATSIRLDVQATNRASFRCKSIVLGHQGLSLWWPWSIRSRSRSRF